MLLRKTLVFTLLLVMLVVFSASSVSLAKDTSSNVLVEYLAPLASLMEVVDWFTGFLEDLPDLAVTRMGDEFSAAASLSLTAQLQLLDAQQFDQTEYLRQLISGERWLQNDPDTTMEAVVNDDIFDTLQRIISELRTETVLHSGVNIQQ